MSDPAFVTDLQAIYGAPSDGGFGSAVFWQPIHPGAGLDAAARERYRYFVGELWQRYGEEAWLGPWQAVFSRSAGGSAGIVAELRALGGSDASSASLILDNPEDGAAAARALAAAFDDPAVSELSIYRTGDGEAMSGLLIAGRRGDHTTILVLLMD